MILPSVLFIIISDIDTEVKERQVRCSTNNTRVGKIIGSEEDLNEMLKDRFNFRIRRPK